MRWLRDLLGRLIALALLVGIGAGGWYAYAGASIGAVDAVWTGRPECAGTGVVDVEAGAAIVARPGMRCVITVRLVNTGSRAVGLASATADAVGPRSAAEVTVESINGQTPAEMTGIDAVVPLDATIGADDSLDVPVVVVFNESGCNSSAGVFSVPDWPRFEVTSLGRAAYRAPQEDLLVRYRTDLLSGCDVEGSRRPKG